LRALSVSNPCKDFPEQEKKDGKYSWLRNTVVICYKESRVGKQKNSSSHD
jgi:hypothetical protein